MSVVLAWGQFFNSRLNLSLVSLVHLGIKDLHGLDGLSLYVASCCNLQGFCSWRPSLQPAIANGT